VSPVFLYAHDDEDLQTLSSTYAPTLRRMNDEFRRLSAIESGEALALVLRFTDAPATSVRSQRRRVDASTLMA
jgi:hypothetical protein